MVNRKKMGTYARKKGVRGELEVAALFRECGWIEAARNLRESQGHHAVRHHDIEKVAPFAVQVKCEEKNSTSDLYELDMTLTDIEAGLLFPLLVRKKKHKAITATMFLNDLTEILLTISKEREIIQINSTDTIFFDDTLVTFTKDDFKELLRSMKRTGAYV